MINYNIKDESNFWSEEYQKKKIEYYKNHDINIEDAIKICSDNIEKNNKNKEDNNNKNE